MTPSSIVFSDTVGKTYSVLVDQPVFPRVKDLVREIGVLHAGDPEDTRLKDLLTELIRLVSPAEAIIESANNDNFDVQVQDGIVLVNGMEVRSVVTERILWGLAEGYNMAPYMAFLANLLRNPSKRSVDQLFVFMEHNRMGITNDGHVLGYKRVREDFRDIYTNTMDNSPGKIVSMPRNAVSDDPASLCSTGLHFCSQSYLPHYGTASQNKVVIVKVDPADVVSVPVDYDNAKARACRYEVLGEYKGIDLKDILASKPVFGSDEFSERGEDGEGHDGYISPKGFVAGDFVQCIDGTDLHLGDVVEDCTYKVRLVSEEGWLILEDIRNAYPDHKFERDDGISYELDPRDRGYAAGVEWESHQSQLAPSRSLPAHLYGPYWEGFLEGCERVVRDSVLEFDHPTPQEATPPAPSVPAPADFMVGGLVICINDFGLGQTDITAGGFYRIEMISRDHTKIFVDVVRRYYDKSRFTPISLEAYQQGLYDMGYAAGVSVKQQSKQVPVTKPSHEGPYWEGFRVGYGFAV